jgi:uncharacterized protein YbaP (TraB family)
MRARPCAALLVAVVAVVAAIAAPSRAGADPAAWRVEEDGAVLWLLGSVHSLRAEDYPLPRIVDRLYAKADGLLFEIDLDDVRPEQIQSELMSAAVLPEGESLASRLPPELYMRAERRAAELGLALSQLDRFEPWLASITLLDVGLSAHGFDPARGVERYLLGRAQHDGKAVLGLESLAAQVGVFDGLSRREQTALLEQTLDELQAPEQEIGPLIDAWQAGTLDALADRLLDDFAGFPDLYERLVVARNRAWVGVLERHLAAGDRLLVVVGALHLVGPNSVVDLLRAQGHTVERIDAP